MNTYEWFKFSPLRWETGAIAMESDEIQFAFFKLCNKYWIKEGHLSKAVANKFAMGNIDYLISEGYCQCEDNNISINYLDEQLEEKKIKQQRLRENARKGGLAKARSMSSKRQANAKQLEDGGLANGKQLPSNSLPELRYKSIDSSIKTTKENSKDKEEARASSFPKFETSADLLKWAKTYLEENPDWIKNYAGMYGWHQEFLKHEGQDVVRQWSLWVVKDRKRELLTESSTLNSLSYFINRKNREFKPTKKLAKL